MTTELINKQNKTRSHEQLPEYAQWLRTEKKKGPANLSWYISPILKMKKAGISDKEFAESTDVDILLTRFYHTESIWDVENGKRRAYLRNIIRMYRAYLNSHSAYPAAENPLEDTTQLKQ